MNQATREKFLKQIEAVEGCEFEMYILDNVPHIAIGHNIVSRQLTDQTMDYLGIEDESDLMKVTLNRDKCEYLFYKDLDIAISDARNAINNGEDGVTLDVFGKLTEERQEVLVDMSFNLGGPRFRKFKMMIAAVQAGDYEEAAAQILDSAAARNPLTAKRYSDLAARMKGTPTNKLLIDVSVPATMGDRLKQTASELESIASELRKLI